MKLKYCIKCAPISDVDGVFSLCFSEKVPIDRTEDLTETVSGEPLIKINFGNYSTKGVLNSLIGSPLGYIGSEEGGELINKIDMSKSKVILIDEFEKATLSVHNFSMSYLKMVYSLIATALLMTLMDT